MGNLLLLLGLIVVFFAFVRTFSRDIRWGYGGAVAEFIAWAIVIPFKVAWALLRALVAIWGHSRARRVRMRGDHPMADRLARAGQRAATRRADRTAVEPPPGWFEGPKPDDDPGFGEWWNDTHGDD